MRPNDARRLVLSALVLFISSGACTNALVEPIAAQDNAVDDHITLHTQYCTDPPDPTQFPVKVLFIVDESGSMCVSDPPGSQGISQASICEVYCSQIVPASGTQALAPGCATDNPKPERVQALEQILGQFQKENDAIEAATGRKGPIQVSIVPFETNVFTNVWPPTQYAYETVDNTSIASVTNYVDALQSELGNGTDYQGVLGYAFSQMSSDMEAESVSGGGALPRSRYVVVWVTDGTPYPRCTSTRTPDGGLPESDYANSDPFNKPYLTWDDDPVDYCLESVGQVDCGACCTNGSACPNTCMCGNAGSPAGVGGYAFGTDRNQNYQIFDEVNQIMALKTQYNVGEINFDTVLVMNELAVQLCGPPCIDLYGDFPNLNPNQESAAAYSVASWLLTNMSRIGNGVFQAFVNGQISQISLAGLDYTSFAAPYVIKNFFVQALRSVPSPGGRIFDSDGEGLPDTIDNSYTAKQMGFNGSDPLSEYNPDSDGDCFDDKFEESHSHEGFDPTTPDVRSCVGNPPVCPTDCTDTDGDGLSSYAETYLGTNPGLVDSDADGIPDGIEARYGFDPNHQDPFSTQDTDGDGISDLREFLANTDPTVADAELYATDAYQYDIKTTVQPDNSVCYDITVSNIRMLQVPSSTNADGFNLFKLWVDEAPSSVLNSDYGKWHASCAWTQYEPPSFRVPEGPILDLTTADGTNNWQQTQNLNSAADYLTKCAGTAP